MRVSANDARHDRKANVAIWHRIKRGYIWRMTLLRIVLVSMWALCSVCASASASSVKPMAMQELADRSAQVCIVRIDSVTSRWSQPARSSLDGARIGATSKRQIESVVRLSEIEFLKNASSLNNEAMPRTLDLVVPGGTLDGFTMELCGAPQFVAGERWMLFLLPQWKTHPCAGIWQGAFRIDESASGPVVRGHAGLVAGINSDGFVQLANTQGARDSASRCCAAHAQTKSVITQSNASASAATPVLPPISLTEWRAQLARFLERSPRLALAKSARIGMHIVATERATPMHDATGAPVSVPARRAPAGTKRPTQVPSIVPRAREDAARAREHDAVIDENSTKTSDSRQHPAQRSNAHSSNSSGVPR